MAASADYIVQGGPGQPRDGWDWTPSMSQRARGFAVYAALRSLGRQGVAELVERSCAHARTFAKGLADLPGCQLVNEVVINQVLFRFQDDQTTDRVLRRVVDSGEAWMSGTTFDGRRAIRLSVTNWQTTESDIARALNAFRNSVASETSPVTVEADGSECVGVRGHVPWRGVSRLPGSRPRSAAVTSGCVRGAGGRVSPGRRGVTT
jgi:glutamate/tyrosine decarboxylase-like PLP-dependent enzyme